MNGRDSKERVREGKGNGRPKSNRTGQGPSPCVTMKCKLAGVCFSYFFFHSIFIVYYSVACVKYMYLLLDFT